MSVFFSHQCCFVHGNFVHYLGYLSFCNMFSRADFCHTTYIIGPGNVNQVSVKLLNCRAIDTALIQILADAEHQIHHCSLKVFYYNFFAPLRAPNLSSLGAHEITIRSLTHFRCQYDAANALRNANMMAAIACRYKYGFGADVAKQL